MKRLLFIANLVDKIAVGLIYTMAVVCFISMFVLLYNHKLLTPAKADTFGMGFFIWMGVMALLHIIQTIVTKKMVKLYAKQHSNLYP